MRNETVMRWLPGAWAFLVAAGGTEAGLVREAPSAPGTSAAAIATPSENWCATVVQAPPAPPPTRSKRDLVAATATGPTPNVVAVLQPARLFVESDTIFPGAPAPSGPAGQVSFNIVLKGDHQEARIDRVDIVPCHGRETLEARVLTGASIKASTHALIAQLARGKAFALGHHLRLPDALPVDGSSCRFT